MRVLPYINQDLDLIIENLKATPRTEGNPAQPLRVRHNKAEWIRIADFAPLQFDRLILQYYKAIPTVAYLLDRTIAPGPPACLPVG